MFAHRLWWYVAIVASVTLAAVERKLPEFPWTNIMFVFPPTPFLTFSKTFFSNFNLEIWSTDNNNNHWLLYIWEGSSETADRMTLGSFENEQMRENNLFSILSLLLSSGHDWLFDLLIFQQLAKVGASQPASQSASSFQTAFIEFAVVSLSLSPSLSTSLFQQLLTTNWLTCNLHLATICMTNSRALSQWFSLR